LRAAVGSAGGRVITVVVPRLTRRRALELAGAATAVAALRPETAASFSRDVPLPSGATTSGRRTLAPQRAPRFDLIGLDFGAAAHVHAEVRARRRGGPWSAWTPVHDASQPVWTGPADVFQVRYSGAARRLRARFVRTGPAPRVTARTAARAAGDRPPIITREGWGGDKLPPKHEPIYGTVELGFVHHTVTANDYEPEDSAGIVLGIAKYHRDHNGWWDIGYQFLCDKYGQLFEGRDGGMQLAVVGAQAQGYNSVSTGISCIGDYTSGPLTQAGIDSVARLLAWKLAVHGVPVRGKVTVTSQGGETNRYAAGRRVTLNRISGHRDGDATSCPGTALYGQLASIRDRAEHLDVSVSALTIAVDRSELTHPDSAVALSGELRYDDGADPTGAPVDIQYETGAGDGWHTIQTVAADADGAFATTITLTRGGRLRAIHAADGVHTAIRSASIAVTVKPALTLSVDPRRIKAGRTTSISATADPVEVTRGWLTIHRRVRHRYVRVLHQRVEIVDGAYETEFVPASAGAYRVTFRAGGALIRRSLRAL
jgi:hypothetical protein